MYTTYTNTALSLKIHLLLFFAIASCLAASGQVLNPNIDFESGTTTHWNFFIGTCCPISTPISTAAIVNRHTLTSGTAVDPYGLFPIISPDGGHYSLRLGNDSAGAQAEKARYFIHVPHTSSEFSILFRYAVVFQDPGHPAFAQPRFEVNAYDSATNDTITCAQFTYVADSTIPGFHRSLLDTIVFYKGWTTGNINLTGRGGTTIIMDFASGDCALGAHFGYGYLDMSTGLFAVEATNCNTDSVTLNAPGGFDHYYWYDSTLTTLLATTASVTLPVSVDPVTYAVILRPANGYGCDDTLYTVSRSSRLSLLTHNSSMVLCNGHDAPMTVQAIDSTGPLMYSWAPQTGLSCTTCNSTTVSFGTSTTYIATVTDTLGCQVSDTIHVAMDSLSLTVSDSMAVCKKTDVALVSIATGEALPINYSWMPPTALSCTNCAATTASPDATVSYTVTVTDSNSCSKQATVQIFFDSVAIHSVRDTNICAGFPLVLNTGLATNASSANYVWSPTDGLSCVYCPNPTATPDKTTSYVLTVTDANQCSGTDTVLLTIDHCDIVFPSAFTPDKDGLNDVIRAVGHLDHYTNYALTIVNRWGARVFYTNDIYTGWDGVYNGVPQDLGTYFYLMSYTLYDKKYMMKGDFQLIR